MSSADVVAATPEKWASEKILIDGDAYFEHVFRDLREAKESIEFETYIYRDDATGRKLAHELVTAAKRGVQVRLIIDGIGASGWFEKNAPRLENEGVQVRVYHPILFSNLWARIKIDLGIATPPKTFERLRGSVLLSRFNRRDHRKMCIVDQKIGYVGSVNVTSDHCASVVGAKAWRDTSVRVHSELVTQMTEAFDAVWERCHDAHARLRLMERLTQPKRKRAGFTKLLRFNYTARLRKQTYRILIRRLSRARHRVWITNPYFAPSRALLKSLAKAHANGADVRIMVPKRSDVFFMPWIATAYYALVLKGGARIFEYCPRMLHAKTALIDQWAIVGSSNFNRRSLVHDFEVDLVLSHTETREELAQTFLHDLQHTDEVKSARGGLTAFLGRLFSWLLKNWL